MNTTLHIQCHESAGRIRPMHGVNNGPTGKLTYERRSNFDSFAALKIPFVRNHDASLSEAYGSQHVVDVHCIFPDFDRDPQDPAAYDFTITDYYTETIIEAGAKVFYRLGASIEHWPRKYGTRMPKDFSKWADICEHIIRHYTEGWAEGFYFDMPYWEIWNEPDLDPDDAENKRTWGGTAAEFFDLYEITAKRLKSRFPYLHIGGPALASNERWADAFLAEMQKRNVPMDFFSWHIYTTNPKKAAERAMRMDALLQKHGYGHVESILNEWNYVHNWEKPLEFLRVVKGLKGASFMTAVMCEMQKNTQVSSMMYYDARVEKIWNGIFDSDTLLPLKGYYAIKAFGKLYAMENAVVLDWQDDELYACAARNGNCISLLITNYADERPEEKEVSIHLDGLEEMKAKFFRLNENSDLELAEEKTVLDGKITLHLPAYESCLITFA